MKLVPSSRLLWLTLDVALIGVVGGLFAQFWPVWLGALGLLILIALCDAVLALSRKSSIRLELPRIVRFSRDREGAIPLTIVNDSERAQRIRLGLSLPAEFISPQGDAWANLPGGVGKVAITWSCTPHCRGSFLLNTVAIETGSPLALWRIRVRSAVDCELRVHPNLLADRKQLAAIFLNRGRDGGHVQRTLGRGREFEKLREYLPGDGFDEIHWKATAKRGRPITKVFQAERTQEIYVVVDASRLSSRQIEHGGISQTSLERFITSALVLLLAAQKQGDKFGLIAYDDRVRIFVRANTGTSHYSTCREAVLNLKPNEITPDIPEIFRYLRMHLRQRALLFFITDLTDPILAEDFLRYAGVLARQHLMLVCQMRTPEIAPLFSGKEVSSVDEIYQRLAGHARWVESRSLAQKLKPLGISSILLENEKMAAQLIEQYMQIKRRQAL